MSQSDAVSRVMATTSVYYPQLTTSLAVMGAYTPPAEHTIQSALDIVNPTTSPTSTYKTRYVMFGIAGVYARTIDNVPFVVDHDPRRLIPHKPVPLKVVPIEEDGIETEHLRLRKELVRDGRTYVAYYAKVLDVEPQLNLRVVRTGQDAAAFSFSLPDIHKFPREAPLPAHRNLDSRELISKEHVISSASTVIRMTDMEFNDIRNGLALLGEPVTNAVISEAVVFFGTEHELVIDTPINTRVQLEVGNSQSAGLMSFDPMVELEISYDLGTSEPVVVHTVIEPEAGLDVPQSI